METTQHQSRTEQAQKSASERKPQSTPELAAASLELQAALGNPLSARPETILRLQRMAGNRAVVNLIQRKVMVGPAHDHYEQEADRVAKQVMNAPVAAPVQKGTSNPLIQRWGKPNDPVTFPDKQPPHVRIKLQGSEVQVPIDVEADPNNHAVFTYLAMATNQEEVATDLFDALHSLWFSNGKYTSDWRKKTKEFISKPAGPAPSKLYHEFDDDNPDPSQHQNNPQPVGASPAPEETKKPRKSQNNLGHLLRGAASQTSSPQNKPHFLGRRNPLIPTTNNGFSVQEPRAKEHGTAVTPGDAMSDESAMTDTPDDAMNLADALSEILEKYQIKDANEYLTRTRGELSAMSPAMAAGQKAQKAGGRVAKVGTAVGVGAAISAIVPGGQAAALPLTIVSKVLSIIGNAIGAAGAIQESKGAQRIASYEIGSRVAEELMRLAALEAISKGVSAGGSLIGVIGVEIASKVTGAISATIDKAKETIKTELFDAVGDDERKKIAVETFLKADHDRIEGAGRSTITKFLDNLLGNQTNYQEFTDLNDPKHQASAQVKGFTTLGQRQEEEEIQAKSITNGESFAPGVDFESRLSAQQSGGQPLPGDTRAFMENRFGADFSGVRVHTDGESAELNREVQAQAFTHGQDIFMGEGKYSPETEAGKQLLAHELTHTIQQAGGGAAAQRAIQRTVGAAAKKARREELEAVLSPERFKRLSSNYFIEKSELVKLIIAEKDAINGMDDSKFDALGTNEDMEKRLRALPTEGLGWFGSKTRLGKMTNWVGSRIGYDEYSQEGEEKDVMLHGGTKEWRTKDYKEEEDDDESPLSIKRVQITLIDADSAKFSKDKGLLKSKGSAELKGNVDGLEGKANVSFELGKSKEKKKEGSVKWNVAGANLKGDGTVTGFVGAKAEGSADVKASYSKEKGFSASGKGKASAFVGLSVETDVEVNIMSGKDSLVKTSGKLGAALGLGGELSGEIAWEGGKLSLKGKGKVAAGLGFGLEYKLEVNIQSIAAKFYTWLKGWGLWMLGY